VRELQPLENGCDLEVLFGVIGTVKRLRRRARLHNRNEETQATKTENATHVKKKKQGGGAGEGGQAGDEGGRVNAQNDGDDNDTETEGKDEVQHVDQYQSPEKLTTREQGVKQKQMSEPSGYQVFECLDQVEKAEEVPDVKVHELFGKEGEGEELDGEDEQDDELYMQRFAAELNEQAQEDWDAFEGLENPKKAKTIIGAIDPPRPRPRPCDLKGSSLLAGRDWKGSMESMADHETTSSGDEMTEQPKKAKVCHPYAS
jgi:hypothetical protein